MLSAIICNTATFFDNLIRWPACFSSNYCPNLYKDAKIANKNGHFCQGNGINFLKFPIATPNGTEPFLVRETVLKKGGALEK